MLWQQNNSKAFRGIVFTGLLALLAGCGNSSAIESMLQPDPELVSQVKVGSLGEAKATIDNYPVATNSEPNSESAGVADTSEVNQPQTTAANPNLPPSFPSSFPIYPQSELQETKTSQDEQSGMLTWISDNNSQAIADYYKAELTARDWKIIKPFNSQQKIARAIAIKNEQRVDLTLLSTNQANGNQGTKLSVIYQPLEADIAASGISQAIDDEFTTKFESNSKSKQAPPTANQPTETESATKPAPNSTSDAIAKPRDLALKNLENTDNSDFINSSVDFTDLREAPEQLTEPLETVAALGVLTPHTNDGNVELTKFAPNAIITRGEYARWLIAANNYYHRDNPGKKIYVSNKTNEPAFQDVKADNPDFAAIQGLAEAGLVPSRLTQDSTKLLFRPDAPLTREDLITWKVPLDSRQALPQASIEAIQESWGFQDAAEIDSFAIRALYADFQNGDLANVRRIFGFTTLFQPKKPVTRAEAATSLWHFGFQGDGITAKEILKTETSTEPDPKQNSNS